MASFNPRGPGLSLLTMLLAQRRTCQSCNVVPQISKLLKIQPSPRRIFLSRDQFLACSLKLSLVCSVPSFLKHHYSSPLQSPRFMPHFSLASRAVCLRSLERGKQQQRGRSCLSAWVIHCKPSPHLNCPWRKGHRCNYIDRGRPNVDRCLTATFPLRHLFQEIDFSE